MNKSNIISDFTKLPGEIVEYDDLEQWEFPTLYSKNKSGSETFWKVYVRVVDKNGKFKDIKDSYIEDSAEIPYSGWYQVDTGLVGGKVRETSPTIVQSGKNIGKKNQTNAFQQALRNVYTLYLKKKDKYDDSPTIDGVAVVPPMTAKEFKNVKNISYPVSVQRKMDGVRCVFVQTPNGDVIAYSRDLKKYRLEHIADELKKAFKALPEGAFIDGEVYKHGIPLQEISGLVRKHKGAQEGLSYAVFDVFFHPDSKNGDMTFLERLKCLKILEKLYEDGKYIEIAHTYVIENEKELDKLYKKFIKEEYEGAMVRLDKPYEPSFNGYHSSYLLKLKPKFDKEFIIESWEETKSGKTAGAFVIICKTPEGKLFKITPAIPIPKRKEMVLKFKKIENGKTLFDKHLKGKPLIVEFDSLSTDNIPLKPRTKMLLRESTDKIVSVIELLQV